MKAPLFNVLVRTSGRPLYFADCIRSIRQQTYPRVRILVSADDAETAAYVEETEGVEGFRVEPTDPEPDTRPRPMCVPFPPNLYFNCLLKEVQEGVVIFLDDDDAFLDPHALSSLADSFQEGADLVLWRVQMSRNWFVPDEAYAGKPPVFCQITSCGFATDHTLFDTVKWTGWKGGDFHLAEQLYAEASTPCHLDLVLTGMQDQVALPGFGHRLDKCNTNLQRKKWLETLGFCPPVPVFTSDEAHRFLRDVPVPDQSGAGDWQKGLALGSERVFEVAVHPRILERVRVFLGPNVLLWGATMISKPPDESLDWHSDVDSSALPKGKALNVWVALQGAGLQSGLDLISFTQDPARPYQQVLAEDGQKKRVRAMARSEHDSVRIHQPELRDGEAVFFDGNLWHASRNHSQETQVALLLQYATPETPIRIAEGNPLDWPFRRLETPLPPTILVCGEDNTGVNHVVPAPLPVNAAL